MIKFDYREIDFEKDLDEVINLIHKNLDSKVTREFFIWKHLKNPFGLSYGLLGLHKGKIVGLRLFMFWEFRDSRKNDIIKTIRPVDTITDIQYRGKGLFKKLTLKGLENCAEKYDFIFNTPNSNSLPGYLKMGWEQLKDVENFKFGILNPLLKPVLVDEISAKSLKFFSPSNSQKIETNKTLAYLKWRYVLEGYRIFQNKDAVIILRIQKIRGIKAFLIYETMGDNSVIRYMLSSISRKFKIFCVYYYNNQQFKNIKLPLIMDRKKATVVYCNMSNATQLGFNFSLGDLDSKL